MTFSHILPILTFILGLVAQSWLGGRKAYETSITDHIADLAELRRAATEYWLKPGPDNPEEVAIDSADVQIALAAVLSFREVAEQYFSQKDVQRYSNLVREMHRTITGGYFETISRAPSPATSIDIARQAASLTHYLRTSRSRVYALSPPRAYDRLQRHVPVVRQSYARSYTFCKDWLSRKR